VNRMHRLFVAAALLGITALPAPAPAASAANDIATAPFDIPALKTKWHARIDAVRATGALPIIDIESSFRTDKLDLERLVRQMDENGVALIAYSHENKHRGWSDAAAEVVAQAPDHFIPVTNGGVHPAWTKSPESFLEETEAHAETDRYPMLGEFEFRHYPSPRQVKRGQMFRDVNIPIDGPLGEELFAFAEKTGLPFEIHYEIEDTLLLPLETMLKRHPRAKVIWCHLAQIRYQRRSTVYSPAYVRHLIETYPNLYFDLAFGGPDSVYPISGERHARIWDTEHGGLKKEWVELIVQYPWRFLAAFDLGGDRQEQLPEYARAFRRFLAYVPEPAREIVAYKAAWKLLFNDEL
jgi:predicted TIM-barrel fold metal-dependent hydrolase